MAKSKNPIDSSSIEDSSSPADDVALDPSSGIAVVDWSNVPIQLIETGHASRIVVRRFHGHNFSGFKAEVASRLRSQYVGHEIVSLVPRESLCSRDDKEEDLENAVVDFVLETSVKG